MSHLPDVHNCKRSLAQMDALGMDNGEDPRRAIIVAMQQTNFHSRALDLERGACGDLLQRYYSLVKPKISVDFVRIPFCASCTTQDLGCA